MSQSLRNTPCMVGLEKKMLRGSLRLLFLILPYVKIHHVLHHYCKLLFIDFEYVVPRYINLMYRTGSSSRNNLHIWHERENADQSCIIKSKTHWLNWHFEYAWVCRRFVFLCNSIKNDINLHVIDGSPRQFEYGAECELRQALTIKQVCNRDMIYFMTYTVEFWFFEIA